MTATPIRLEHIDALWSVLDAATPSSIGPREINAMVNLVQYDVPKLTAALRAVLELHKPVRFYMGRTDHWVHASSSPHYAKNLEARGREVVSYVACERCQSAKVSAIRAWGELAQDHEEPSWPCETVQAVTDAGIEVPKP